MKNLPIKCRKSERGVSFGVIVAIIVAITAASGSSDASARHDNVQQEVISLQEAAK